MSVEIQRTEVVLNNRGARGTSGSVLVSSATGQAVSSRMGLAAISSPSAGQVAFLTETGREGMFAFDSSDLTAAVGGDPAQAIYVAPASATSGISGAWVRRYNGSASAKWFGAVGDGTTNDATALQRWLDHGDWLRLPVGEYYSSDNLILRQSAVVEGDGYGFDNRLVDGTAIQGYDNQPGSRIRFAAGYGFKIEPQTAQTDETATIVVSQEGAYNSVVRNIALIGAGTGATATGLYCRTVINFDNVHVIHFTGKGFDISAASGPASDTNAEYGNASFSNLRNCHAISNGSHGFHCRGVDANVLKFDNCNSQLNGGWGFLDESLIGNTYISGQAATNALGSYKCIADSSGGAYIGCYVEVGVGQAPDLSRQCVVHGGALAAFVNQVNVGTNGNPTVTSGAGTLTGKLTLRDAQVDPGAFTDRAVLYRGFDAGLVLQGGPGGTYSHTLTNAAGQIVLQIVEGSKAVLLKAPVSIAGNQIIGARLASVPAGTHSSSSPTFAEFNALVDVVNLLNSRLSTHGLIGP